MTGLKSAGIGMFAAGMMIITAGCGSGGTQVRVMNAIDGESTVSMQIDNNNLASGVAFGTASSYGSVSSGSHTLEIQAANAPLFNQSITLSGDSNNTVLATDAGPTVLSDNKSTPSSGDIQIRAVNASTALGNTDVYIVAPGTDISTVNATISALAFRTASGYQTVAAGSYVVEFTQTGSKVVVFSTSALSFSAGQIRTVVALDNPSGGFSTAVLSDLN